MKTILRYLRNILNSHKFRFFIAFAAVWSTLFMLNLFWSRDVLIYRTNFEHIADLIDENQLHMNWSRGDPSYAILELFFAYLGIPFDVFLGIVIASCLGLKWFALRRLTENPGWLAVFPYLAVLSFLHEGTQIRIALALSIAMWSLVLWSKQKNITAFLFICFATSFHISAAAFLFVFLIIGLSERFGRLTYIVYLITALVFAYSGLIYNLFLWWGELVNARYMNYLRGAIFSTLNVSGLFQYYFIFIIFIISIVHFFKVERSSEEKRFNLLSVFSSVLAIVVLIDLRFNTIIASRLADLLIFPLLVSLGIILQDLKNTSRTLFFIFFAILLGYCAIRGYITFSPRPPSPLPSIE